MTELQQLRTDLAALSIRVDEAVAEQKSDAHNAEPEVWPKNDDTMFLLFGHHGIMPVAYNDSENKDYVVAGSAFRTLAGAERWRDAQVIITELANTEGRAVREFVDGAQKRKRLWGFLIWDGGICVESFDNLPGLFDLLWESPKFPLAAMDKVGADRIAQAAETMQMRGML